MDNWNYLKKELACNGIFIINNKYCKDSLGNKKKNTQCLAKQTSNFKENCRLFKELWDDVNQVLLQEGSNTIDSNGSRYFVLCVKDLYDLLDCFEEASETELKINFKKFLMRDVNSFTSKAVYNISNYKMSIDWVFRSIVKHRFVMSMLKMTLLGEDKVNSFSETDKNGLKTAAISGPWANLDLPMGERMYSWADEAESINDDQKGKQAQRRYRKGLINYNKLEDPEEGDFWVWYEGKNAPFLWTERNSEDPYPHRNLLQQ